MSGSQRVFPIAKALCDVTAADDLDGGRGLSPMSGAAPEIGSQLIQAVASVFSANARSCSANASRVLLAMCCSYQFAPSKFCAPATLPMGTPPCDGKNNTPTALKRVISAHSYCLAPRRERPLPLSPNYTILLACALRFLLCVYDLSSHEFLAMTGFHPSSLAASIISLRLQCRSRGELHPFPFRRSPGLLQLGQQPCSILGLLMKFYGIIYPFRGIMILVGVEVKFSFVNLYNLRK